MTFKDIQYKIQNSKSLDFGKILDQSINLFKKIWLQGFLMILIMMVLGGVLSFLLVSVSLIPNPYDTSGYENIGFFSLYSKSAFDNLLQAILITPIFFGMLSGFYRVCKSFDLNESQSNDLFYFFKGELFRKVLLLGLISALISTVAQALFLIALYICFLFHCLSFLLFSLITLN